MSQIGFDGKVAVITGAGGGLGRSHALLLASRGAQIVVNDLGGAVDGSGASTGPAEKVVEEITAAGGVAVANNDSVTTIDGGKAIIQTALDAFGRVDIVINNAGILRDKSFANMTPDLWDAVIECHLRGAYCVTQAAWPHMKAQNYGRIVSTSSAAGLFGNFGQANYGAAKMGLVGLTRVLAQEGAKSNIKANAIGPVARTRMTEDLLGPLAERLSPELVSPVVAWLAHEDCDVTGEIYAVGGGRVARIFIGETQGFAKADLTIEDIRDNWTQIRDEEGYSVPKNVTEDINLVVKSFGS
jgi:NAD(P)-dependent dehydrogenase (short-subunit alcohol dehydrogenase family)